MKSTAYYNEHDPKTAAWLRELIKASLIAPGEVDERSIEDVLPSELDGFTQCHFFAGIGVWSYALRCAGWPDDRKVWTGSCPCQPFSAAGKGGGTDDQRHLWPSFFWLIKQCQPSVIFGEQVASKDGLAWLDIVQSDLEAEKYAVAPFDLCAAGFGAPSIRQRLFWVAESAGKRGCGRNSVEKWNSEKPGRPGADVRTYAWPDGFGSCSTLTISDVLSPSYGAAARVGRLRGYGNAIVAPVAEEFIRAYIERELGE